MRVFYSDHYTIDLPEGHRFPMRKYRMLREALVVENIVAPDELHDPGVATREDVLHAHTERYVDGVINGTLEPIEIRRIGFPWSPSLVTRSLATVSGCWHATLAALEDGFSGNLAGGTHHAMSDAGEGFCVFNDIAISTLRLLNNKRVRRVAIIDLDVHQGNGNSEILGDRNDVTIFSMHGEKNYPFRRVPSTLDIDLPDETGDDEYLKILGEHLPLILDRDPDIVFYQCGVDPLVHDSLGRLSLTFEGLMMRDRMVLGSCRDRSIPVMMALGGGYARPIELTVQAQCNTYRVAREVFNDV